MTITPDPAPDNRPRILIVEDEPAERDFLEMLLEAEYQVASAPDAESAQKVYNLLDFTHAYQAFLDGTKIASMDGIRKGILEFAGVAEILEAGGVAGRPEQGVLFEAHQGQPRRPQQLQPLVRGRAQRYHHLG